MKMKSEAIDQLAIALCKCQSELKPAIKDSENPFFHSNYADLESVWEACRKPLADNNLAVVQTVDYEEMCDSANRTLFVKTLLVHKSGQWIEGRAPILLAKQDSQSLGSAISYMRRYSLAAIVGITQKDDDAEKATDRNNRAQPLPVKSVSRPVHHTVADNPLPSHVSEQPPRQTDFFAESVEEMTTPLPNQPAPNFCSCGGMLKFSTTKNKWYCADWQNKSVEHKYNSISGNGGAK